MRDYRGAVLPLVAVAAWWGTASMGMSDSKMLVAPDQVWNTAETYVTSGHLWTALGASLARDLAGFAIGASLGLLLGALLGLSHLGERLLGGSFNAFKQVSLFAWIPLISVWFGLGDVAKVVFLSLAALVPVAVNTRDGLRKVPATLLEVAKVYGYSRWQTLWLVRLPAALPSLFTGLYLALIYAWLATIGAEYLLVSGEGIGNTLIDGSEHFRMDQVLFGMLVIGLVGWALNGLARLAEQRLRRLYGNL
ncbi:MULTISPECIES: ABC transporter permease [unclassified Pseudomonas]|uniref:ABC transporter permease n=1 Tax=unclassified Pseudomonas TaxID=196821 RepID=UPI000BCE2A9E|nr:MULTISPECIES: ABC transporter permease [unclassified Pseudomonas]PVZ12508.1 sulfonate transport system permease protein [Pseudomonas sp. URIL14HWK12:I12]PVZ23340.1 sulfonate transport system permease protein [Pseudomonas sp. URIL14HWK12:I10]PVZ32670.1 sulfonate transport system permease protein [Pseudomonas sp. URIL14HWK12:I11]SNZ13824.1 sulfonate transport system permease protein [Pseudomonas sp. URIL14HWK12:I9]